MATSAVLITGISGFIARHCAVEMLNAGYRVRGTVRSLARTAGIKESLARHADASRLEFIPATEAAAAMASSLVERRLA